MRPRPWLKVMVSLCVLGLLLGLMIGRLVNPPHEGPTRILAIEPATDGLVLTLDAQPPEQRVRLPMRPGCRSLNLSNTVAVTVYEAWRQHGFAMD